MISQKRIKRFQRALARWGLHSSTFFITRLPFSFVRVLTRVFIAIGFIFTVKQKRIAQESLTIAFQGEKSPEDIDAIFKNCFENIGKSMIELIYYMAHPEMIDGKVVIKHKERLDRAFDKGKGVIAVSAHFGNFPLMLLYLARQGYAPSAIIKRTHDEKIEKYFQSLRERLGLRTIYSHPRSQCVNDSLKVLRHNEFLFIPLDQNFGRGGVFVDFFGQKAATATGPVIFAMRTGAPILPVFVVRQEQDVHHVIVEEPIYLQQGSNDQETIFINIARITRIIETYIRQYPHEWGWMHRRWKSRPASVKE